MKTSSNNGAIKKTYNAQTLLSLKECPFSRTPIVVIGPDNELKQRIQAHVERKEQIAENAALPMQKRKNNLAQPRRREKRATTLDKEDVSVATNVPLFFLLLRNQSFLYIKRQC